jgi:phasin family protein
MAIAWPARIKGAGGIRHQFHHIIDIARRNLNSSFDLAKSLVGAKNLADMVELQTAYWQKQFGALTAQAEEVHALSTKVTADTAEPIKARATRKHG